MARLITLILTAVLTFVPPADAQSNGVCVIVTVDGQAVVFALGVRQRPAEPGLGLGNNAILRTRTNTRVTLMCTDQLQIIVGPQTEITVARLVDGGPRPFGLRLMEGIVGFLFDGDGDGVQVRTPSAVAAVRSTQWAMRVEDEASAIFARKGEVFVLADDGSVQLGSGEGVDVTARGEIGPVARWGRARIDLFSDLLGPDW